MKQGGQKMIGWWMLFALLVASFLWGETGETFLWGGRELTKCEKGGGGGKTAFGTPIFFIFGEKKKVEGKKL